MLPFLNFILRTKNNINMLANKTFNIFVIATAFMLLATVEAAPAAEAAAQGTYFYSMFKCREPSANRI